MTIPRLATRSSARPILLPLLRSPLTGELLAWVYLHPELSYSVTELSRRFHASRRSLEREADQLAESGLIRCERRGNLRLLRAELAGPLTRPLTDLLALTYGPLAVLTDVLPSVPGVAEAYLYGCWAERYAGVPGPPPRDVEVLVVGESGEADLGDAVGAAEHRLGRKVDVCQIPPGFWRTPNRDPFLSAVRSGPLCAIV
jgi:DNA-binding transcriptional ArsR family regulator